LKEASKYVNSAANRLEVIGSLRAIILDYGVTQVNIALNTQDSATAKNCRNAISYD